MSKKNFFERFFKKWLVLHARSVQKPLKVPSLERSMPKPLNVPSLARSVPKPLKLPSLARSAPKPLSIFGRRWRAPLPSLWTPYQLVVSEKVKSEKK